MFNKPNGFYCALLEEEYITVEIRDNEYYDLNGKKLELAGLAIGAFEGKREREDGFYWIRPKEDDENWTVQGWSIAQYRFKIYDDLSGVSSRWSIIDSDEGYSEEEFQEKFEIENKIVRN